MMKFIYPLFLISLMIVVIGSLLNLSSFGSFLDSTMRNNSSGDANYNLSDQNELKDKTPSSNTLSSSSSFSSSNPDKDKGLLIVKVDTVNGNLGKNMSSDFVVQIHANNPIPPTFKGNSETWVKLSMGMYAVTISTIPNYNSSYSSDCTGGIMKIETKTCTIVNTFNGLL